MAILTSRDDDSLLEESQRQKAFKGGEGKLLSVRLTHRPASHPSRCLFIQTAAAGSLGRLNNR